MDTEPTWGNVSLGTEFRKIVRKKSESETDGHVDEKRKLNAHWGDVSTLPHKVVTCDGLVVRDPVTGH